MFLTLNNFLSYFPGVKISKSDFVKKFTITYSPPVTLEQIFSLKQVPGRKRPIIKDPKTDLRYLNKEKVIDYFYEIVVEKKDYYLSKFYSAYFEIKGGDPRNYTWDGVNIYMFDPTNKKKKKDVKNPSKIIQISQDDLKHSLSIQKNDRSRVIVRNLFALELLLKTEVTNSVKAKVPLWKTLDNMYNKLILEDRLFAPSSISLFLREKRRKHVSKLPKEINYNNLYYLIQQYQPKASILNPYSVKWLLDNIFIGERLFTPVLSWCSYEIAFMHSKAWTDYVGVDVMPNVCKKAEWLANYYYGLDPKTYNPSNKKVEIYCQRSEHLLKLTKFKEKYYQWFDTILICPPYFDMEIYSEGEQSISSYPNYKDWLEKYWHETVKVCDYVLKHNKTAKFAVIVNDYFSLNGAHYPLTTDFNKYCIKYFDLHEIYYLYNRTSPLRVNHKDRTEKIYIYTRKQSNLIKTRVVPVVKKIPKIVKR